MIQVQITICDQQIVINAGSLEYEKDRIVISEIQSPQQKPPAKVTEPVIVKAGKKISPLHGKPAATSLKKCPVCEKNYKPMSNGQKFCEICRPDKKKSVKAAVVNISHEELLDPMHLKK